MYHGSTDREPYVSCSSQVGSQEERIFFGVCLEDSAVNDV